MDNKVNNIYNNVDVNQSNILSNNSVDVNKGCINEGFENDDCDDYNSIF
jgi:hypothetical protein